MPRPIRFPEEFRARAVDLLRTSGKTMEEIARELGCSRGSIRKWAKQRDLDSDRRTTA